MTESSKELQLLFFYCESRNDERRVKKKESYAMYVHGVRSFFFTRDVHHYGEKNKNLRTSYQTD